MSLVRLSPPTFYHKRQEQGSWWFQILPRNFLSGTLMGVREFSVSCVTIGNTVAKFLPPCNKVSSPLASRDVFRAFLKALPTASLRPFTLGPGIRSQIQLHAFQILFWQLPAPSTEFCSSSLLLRNKSLQHVACGTSTADCGHGVCGSYVLEGGLGAAQVRVGRRNLRSTESSPGWTSLEAHSGWKVMPVAV